jgi:hypothetical protein
MKPTEIYVQLQNIRDIENALRTNRRYLVKELKRSNLDQDTIARKISLEQKLLDIIEENELDITKVIDMITSTLTSQILKSLPGIPCTWDTARITL